MSGRVEAMTEWVYRGIWGVLTEWFRVPDQPPTLPCRPGETVDSFRPAAGFLRYLKFQFWLVLLLIDGLIFVFWLVIAIASPLAGGVLALPALAIAVLPDILAYVAIHLRYDTTWYVLSERSLRIRRGIWVIHETTITHENVQNVTVQQGPLQRYFGIADVRIETAGGGGAAAQQQGAGLAAHQGLIEGVANAPQIRDLLLARLRQSRSAGLGDDPEELPRPTCAWSPEHLTVLREIRAAVAAMK